MENCRKYPVFNGMMMMVLFTALCMGLSSLAVLADDRFVNTLLFFLRLLRGIFCKQGIQNLDQHGVDGHVCVALIALILLATILAWIARGQIVNHSMPCPTEAAFDWPFSTPFSWYKKSLLKILDYFGIVPLSAGSFGVFCDFRTGLLAPHLESSDAQKGPNIPSSATLCPDDLKAHLMEFDALGTEEMWSDSKALLYNILLNCEEALEKRLELIDRAFSKIWIMTWVFEESVAGNRLADALIGRVQDGLDVRVIIDAVTLYYLHQKRELHGSNEIEILTKLTMGGVAVRMLGTWYTDNPPSFVIGSHRKLMLVDDAWLITGGRNINDKYFTSHTFHYDDADVLLRGHFQFTTSFLYARSWENAKEIIGVPSNGPTVVTPSRRGVFPLGPPQSALPPGGSDVTLFQLDHKGGNPDGQDIIFSTLLFMIETSQIKIDLVFGYFQLFSKLDDAMTQAIARGVKIRVISNSSETNGLPYLNNVFRNAFARLLDLGVEVYVVSDPKQLREGGSFCLHYKVALVDDLAALVGSWNCIGMSVFYDDDFSVAVFDASGKSRIFAPFENLIEDSIASGRLVQMWTVPEGFKAPFMYTMFGSKNAARQIKRGF